MSKRSGTLKKSSSDMAAYSVSPGNFWDVGNYTRCAKRITDSNNLCDDLIKMFTERAEIESKYSRKLTDWHDRWSKHLDASPAVYATMKTAELGTLKEASDRAVIHMDCWSKIHNQVIEFVKREKESKYHKAFVGIKEAKELDEEFNKAQKPWATAFGKVQRAKKNYHSTCKQRDAAKSHLDQAKTEGEVPMDKVKKLEDVLQKNEKSVDSMQIKYQEKLSRIEPINVSYEDEMRKVYSKFSKSEEERKDFLQRVLVEFHKSVNICEDPRLLECFDNQINVAYSGKSSYDLQWWTENFGADMPRTWPKFEVFSSSEWYPWSRNSMSSAQKKQSRRYLTRPRPHPYGLKHRELGDLPELPPPISAVEPPEIQRYNSVSVPRSSSNQLMQQERREPDHQQTVSPVQEQPVAAYEPTEDPASNPFMNGDDEADGDEWDEPPPVPGEGVPVRALYDYSQVEDDELSFKAGDVLTKLSEEDEQGWCRGSLNGKEGLYPANYIELM